jgi:hypothetical protein
MAFGPAAEAIKDMDGALSRLIEHNAGSSSPNARQVMLLAARTDTGVLRIQALLPPHIAEENENREDELERRMANEDKQVQNALKHLDTLLPSSPDVETAKDQYRRFTELKSQIIKLSRENTNVRSLSISLNEKRRVTALCQDSLATLEKAVDNEEIPGEKVVSPRTTK